MDVQKKQKVSIDPKNFRRHHSKFLTNKLAFSTPRPIKSIIATIRSDSKYCDDINASTFEILADDDLLKRLRTCSNDLVERLYRTSVANDKEKFSKHFRIICQLFGERNMKSTLAGLVKDCERYGRIDFFAHVNSGLLLCNISESDAMTLILENGSELTKEVFWETCYQRL